MSSQFELGKWYKTNTGFDVQFVLSFEKDGMYNVFRHTGKNDYKPFYTDKKGETPYGVRILI